MIDWLFEGCTPVYVVLAALAVFLLLVWWQTRKRGWLIAAVIAAGLVGIYALLDKAIETDREQIVRKIHEMATAVNTRQLDALFANISDDFRSPQGRSKQSFRDLVKGFIDVRIVENVKVWDIVCEGTPSREHPPARVFFSAKADGGQTLLADCEAVFDFHPQHGWRMKNLRLFKPQTTEEWPLSL